MITPVSITNKADIFANNFNRYDSDHSKLAEKISSIKAEQLFELIKDSSVKKVLEVLLRSPGQLIQDKVLSLGTSFIKSENAQAICDLVSIYTTDYKPDLCLNITSDEDFIKFITTPINSKGKNTTFLALFNLNMIIPRILKLTPENFCNFLIEHANILCEFQYIDKFIPSIISQDANIFLKFLDTKFASRLFSNYHKEAINKVFTFDREAIAVLLDSEKFIELLRGCGGDGYKYLTQKLLELSDEDFADLLESEAFCQNIADNVSLQFVEKLFKLDSLDIKAYLKLSQENVIGTTKYRPKLNFVSIIEKFGVDKVVELIKGSNLKATSISEMLHSKIETKYAGELEKIYSSILRDLGIDTLTKIASLLSPRDKVKLEKLIPLKSDSCKFDVSKLETSNDDVKKLISKFYYVQSAEKDAKIKELAKKLEKITENDFFKEFIKLAANLEIDLVIVDEAVGAYGFYKPTTKNIVIKNIDDFSTTIHELTHAVAHEFNGFKGCSLDSLQFAMHAAKGKLSEEEIESLSYKEIKDITPEQVSSLAAELKIESAALQAEIDLMKSQYLEPLQRLVADKDKNVYPASQDKNESFQIQYNLALKLSYAYAESSYTENEYPSELIAYAVQALSEFASDDISIDSVIRALKANIAFDKEIARAPVVEASMVSSSMPTSYENSRQYKKGDWIEINGEKKVFDKDTEVKYRRTEKPYKPPEFLEDSMDYQEGDWIEFGGEKRVFDKDQLVKFRVTNTQVAHSSYVQLPFMGATEEEMKSQAANLLQIVKFVAGHFRESIATLIAEHEVEHVLCELVTDVEVFAAVAELVTLTDIAEQDGVLLDDARGFSGLVGDAGFAAVEG